MTTLVLSILNGSSLLLKMAGEQWLSGRVLDSRPTGRGFEPHRRHCVVFLSKNINPSSVLVQPRKTRPFITARLLMGRKESNQTKKNIEDEKDNFTWMSLNFVKIPSPIMELAPFEYLKN